MRPERRLPPDTDIVAFLLSLPPARRAAAIDLLGPEERDALDRDWPSWAHEGQRPPADARDAWSTWVLMAGRGFGKTLSGANWVTGLVAAGDCDLRIALVGATLDDARRVMVEGRSGLLAVAGAWVRDWRPRLRSLRFRTGAEATLFSGASPDMLRGPEHHYAWCDELAKWERPQDCWDMLQLGLRLGARPQALVTTTPRPGPVLRAIMAGADTITTGGATRRNPHTSRAWKAKVEAAYAGTRLGRQELDGELLPDAAGALWTVELIERARCRAQGSDCAAIAMQREETSSVGPCGHPVPPRDGEGDRREAGVEGAGREPIACGPPPPSARRAATSPSRGGYERTLIAVDPPSGDGTCGIIACARDGEGIVHVLADHSVTARSPEGWARAVAAAAGCHGTHEVVAEANQGGRMVKAVLLAADAGLTVRLVHARVGKAQRAEPVAHLFEGGRVRLHGHMPELEAQLLGLIAGGGYEGPGTSPDRADAMVWGVGEVARVRGVRVRGV